MQPFFIYSYFFFNLIYLILNLINLILSELHFPCEINNNNESMQKRQMNRTIQLLSSYILII